MCGASMPQRNGWRRELIKTNGRTQLDFQLGPQTTATICWEKVFFFNIMPFFVLPALLELDLPATLNKAVALVCLPKQGQSVSTGKYCTVTGEHVRFNQISHLCAGWLLNFFWLFHLCRLWFVSSQGGVGQDTIARAPQSFKRLAFQWHGKTIVGLICDTGAQWPVKWYAIKCYYLLRMLCLSY